MIISAKRNRVSFDFATTCRTKRLLLPCGLPVQDQESAQQTGNHPATYPDVLGDLYEKQEYFAGDQANRNGQQKVLCVRFHLPSQRSQNPVSQARKSQGNGCENEEDQDRLD
jgi:hypothetical protein